VRESAQVRAAVLHRLEDVVLLEQGLDGLEAPRVAPVDRPHDRQAREELAARDTQLAVLDAQLAVLDAQLTALHMDIKRIKSTVSWQVTKPLRFIWNTLLRHIFTSTKS